MTTDDRRAVSFAVTDRPVTPSDVDAVRALHEAVAVIEQNFVNGSDWPAVVGQLRLMIRILDEPPRMCRRCRCPFRLEHGAAFALYRRALAFPRHCESCRAARRQERIERVSTNA
jgi:hypothetical protein